MAGPPRFTPMNMGNGFRMQMPPMGGPMGGPSMMQRNMPMHRGPMASAGPPMHDQKTSQITTVFVGNISEKSDPEFVRQMLEMCGKVANWKRMAGVNQKLQAFGFCDFDEPEGTLRALRVLNEFQLGDKKLTVKVETKHREQLKTYAEKEAGAKAEGSGEELPATEEALKKDEELRLKILARIETDFPDLLKYEDGEVDDKSAKKDVKDGKDDKKDSRGRRRSRSRSRSRSRGRNGRKSPRNKRRRRSTSSSRSSRSSGSSRSSSSSSYDSRNSRDRKKRESKRRARSPSKESKDSEDEREKRELKRIMKRKEAEYNDRLKSWEGREKKMARKYERDDEREKKKKLETLKEAKKLRAFLEDYDDERDDPKYYNRRDSLYQRRRDFEREKEADAKDRQKEQQEIEDLKKQIIEESKAKAGMKSAEVEEEAQRRHQAKEAAARAKAQRDGSGSPNPHQPLGQRKRAPGEESSSDSGSGSDDEKEGGEEGTKENDIVQEAKQWSTVAVDSPSVGSNGTGTSSPNVASPVAARSPLMSSGPIRLNTLKQSSAAVFDAANDDDEEVLVARKKLKKFEITHEERMKTMTAEELRKMQKEVASSIPSDMTELFATPIRYDLFEKADVMTRIRPWISRKIKGYIGEEDPTLINFIIEKVQAQSAADKIQEDIAMIIDNDSEDFVKKLWRLLIYEGECAARGIPHGTIR